MELKSQIEMLKAALIGLCKDKQMEIPGTFIPMVLQQQKENKSPMKRNLDNSCIESPS